MRGDEIIWEPHHPHLGNLWASCNFFLNESVRTGTKTLISRRCRGTDVSGTVQEILNELESSGKTELVDKDATHFITEEWRVPYCPTRSRWSPNRFDRVCFQFDGVTHPQKTNPPPEDLAQLLGAWLPAGIEFIRLGRPLSIADDVRLLSRSDAFLGVDSGMSHIAHSAMVPCFLLQYLEPLEKAHPNKSYVKCEGAVDAIAKIRYHLQYNRGSK